MILVGPFQLGGFYDSVTARTKTPHKQRQTHSLLQDHTGDCLPSPGAAVFHCATTSAQKTDRIPAPCKDVKEVPCTSPSLFLTPDTTNLWPYAEHVQDSSSDFANVLTLPFPASGDTKCQPRWSIFKEQTTSVSAKWEP